jgi:phosphoglycolate phosphatase
MKYELAIFDMDGTILYTLDDIVISMNEALRKNHLPETDRESLRKIIGNGIMNEVRRSVPEDADEELVMKVFADFNEHYGIHCSDHTHPYEGICGMLERLKEAGMKTAVVSNKGDYAVQELNVQYFDGLLDAGVGEKENIRRKPAPDTVFEVLEQLHIEKEKAVYIGDSEVDLETAANAGMDCIIVSWGYRDKEDMIALGAQTTVDTVEELEQMLMK